MKINWGYKVTAFACAAIVLLAMISTAIPLNAFAEESDGGHLIRRWLALRFSIKGESALEVIKIDHLLAYRCIL